MSSRHGEGLKTFGHRQTYSITCDDTEVKVSLKYSLTIRNQNIQQKWLKEKKGIYTTRYVEIYFHTGSIFYFSEIDKHTP